MNMKRKFTLLILALCCAFIPGWGQEEQTDFYDLRTTPEVNIQFAEENWRTLLDSLRYNGDGLLRADVTINGESFPGAGIRYLDAYTFQPLGARNSIYIQLDYTNADLRREGYRSVQLSCALRDPSMVREVVGLEIARKYMPAAQANFAKVNINGKYHGLFVNVEPLEAPFLQRYFGDSQGALYRSSPKLDKPLPENCMSNNFGSLLPEENESCLNFGFERLQGSSFAPLVRLTKTLNSSPDNLKAVLQVDHVLWMLALDNVLVNLRSYIGLHSPDYLLYQDAGGRFSTIVTDLNWIGGSYKNTGVGGDLSEAALTQLDPFLHQNNRMKPLVSQLLKDEFYQKLYLSHVWTIVHAELLSGNFEARVKELQAKIRPLFVADPNKYYTEEDFDRSTTTTTGKVSRIPGLLTFMEARSRFLKKHPQLLFVPPAIGEVKFKTRERFSPNRIQDFQLQVPLGDFVRQARIFYRFGDSGPFLEAPLEDDGLHNDEKAGDKIYGITLKPRGDSSRLEYYIAAENAKMVNFMPANYMFERQVMTLDELNR